MTLDEYWPTPENTEACIRQEAETDDEDVLLAVHRPVRFVQQTFSRTDKRVRTQEEFLEAFLTQHVDSGTVLFPIVGNSGVGKSHVIRWLAAQLNCRPGHEHRVIIRIPKSASLKAVLRCILDKLDSARYADVRRQLTVAQEQLDIHTTGIWLQTELRLALGRYQKHEHELNGAAMRAGRPSDSERRTRAALAAHLQNLLADVELEPHFTGSEDALGVLGRISQRVTSGGQPSDERLPQFDVADLELAGVKDISLDKAAAKTQLAYRTIANNLELSVKILNDVIDDAVGGILAHGDVDIFDVFVSIRRSLLEEGKELVLLIEDFAALTGIQRALIDLFTKEGTVDGQRVLCNIRAALAVTDGFLERSVTTFDTMATRAKHEWFIERLPDESDEDIVDGVVELVGRYLNAARVGVQRLREARARAGVQQLTGWVPKFEVPLDDRDQAILDAFGSSADGYSLFPFNRSALEILAKDKLQQAGGMRLNPRLVINYILRETLLDERRFFEEREFPRETFGGFVDTRLNFQVRSALQNEIPKPLWNRYWVCLYFWGRAPAAISDLNLAPEIYEAFDLKPLDPKDSRGRTRTKAEPSANARTTGDKPTRSQPQDEQRVSGWAARLQAWADGGTLNQSDSLNLRKHFVDAVRQRIDWETAGFPKPRDEEASLIKKVFIDRAAVGAGSHSHPSAEGAFFVLAGTEDRNSAEFVNNLLSATVIIEKEGRCEPGDEHHLVRYEALLERYVEAASDYCSSAYFIDGRDPVAEYAKILIASAKVQGVHAAFGKQGKKLIQALFVDAAAADSSPHLVDKWTAVKGAARELRTTQDLREPLLAIVGARQGTGKAYHGVDAVRLIEALKGWDGSFSTLPNRMDRGGKVYGALAQQILDGKVQEAVKAQVQQLTLIAATVRACFGQQLNPEARASLTKQFAEMAGVASKHGLLSSDQRTLNPLLKRIESTAVESILGKLERMADASIDTCLQALGELSSADITRVAAFSKDGGELQEILQDTLDKVNSELANLAQSPEGAALDELAAAVASFASTLASLNETSEAGHVA